VRNGCDCQHHGGRGLGSCGMVNQSESPINVVRFDQRLKDAVTLGPKGKWSGLGAPNSPGADVAPPAKRHSLTHSGTGTERGKPVVLPAVIVGLTGKRLARGADGAAGMG